MMKKITFITLVAILSSVASLFLYDKFMLKKTTSITSPPVKVIPSVYSYEQETVSAVPPNDFVEAASKSIDAVVHVKNTSSSRGGYSALDFFFNRQAPESRIGTGSGVIVSPDGYIITNNHVIEDATKIEVTTNNNKVYEAKLIGTDQSTDIAVLKINSKDKLPYLFFGNSENTKIGEWVLAVGNPFNLTSTVTAGIISAKSRDLNENDRKNQSFIQTDAAVNMGNSGGALVNTRGELIGINTAITSMSGGFVGYSFAVPSNIARKIFEDILEFGDVQKGLLGVSGRGLNSQYSDFLKIEETEGFYIADIEEGMGAQKAGLKKGDIIIKVDNVVINTFSDLTGYLGTKNPSDIVEVFYIRDGLTKNVKVKLNKLQFAEFQGLKFKNLSESEISKFNIETGVKIINSENSIYPIDEGTIVIKINGNEIKNTNSLDFLNKEYIKSITILTENGERERILFR
jgi:Do/DeqQ family serine protease